MYGHETQSFTLREERGLCAFENRVLRQIFGLIREEVTGGRKGLHQKLHNLDTPLNTTIILFIKLKTMRDGKCSTRGQDEKCTQKT